MNTVTLITWIEPEALADVAVSPVVHSARDVRVGLTTCSVEGSPHAALVANVAVTFAPRCW
jgi:hypothetical protein